MSAAKIRVGKESDRNYFLQTPVDGEYGGEPIVMGPGDERYLVLGVMDIFLDEELTQFLLSIEAYAAGAGAEINKNGLRLQKGELTHWSPLTIEGA